MIFILEKRGPKTNRRASNRPMIFVRKHRLQLATTKPSFGWGSSKRTSLPTTSELFQGRALSCRGGAPFFPFRMERAIYTLIACCFHFAIEYRCSKKNKQLLYFEWSPPWHVGWRLSGEGCHWEYDGKNGEFENIDFRFPWLSDTSEMGFGHDVPFLNYSDRLPHPSDLCQPDWVRWG